jgi:hypothetical protein
MRVASTGVDDGALHCGGAVASSCWWQQRIAEQPDRAIAAALAAEATAPGAAVHAQDVAAHQRSVVRAPRADATFISTERFLAYFQKRVRT